MLTRRRVAANDPARASNVGAALDLALRYLGTRPRSEREVRQRLAHGGFDETAIERVVAQLRSTALLDDASFARAWVEQRQTFRPRGARLLRAELQQRGVGRELASEAAESTHASAQDDAYRAAEKRAWQLRNLDERAFQRRLGQHLARRGFDWETSGAAVSQLWAEVSTSSGTAPVPTG